MTSKIYSTYLSTQLSYTDSLNFVQTGLQPSSSIYLYLWKGSLDVLFFIGRVSSANLKIGSILFDIGKPDMSEKLE